MNNRTRNFLIIGVFVLCLVLVQQIPFGNQDIYKARLQFALPNGFASGRGAIAFKIQALRKSYNFLPKSPYDLESGKIEAAKWGADADSVFKNPNSDTVHFSKRGEVRSWLIDMSRK